MAVTNFLVTSLPAYVQDNQDILIKNFALVGSDTRSRIALQTGVKNDAHINVLDIRPVLQDGKTCGFNALDEIELSQRLIHAPAIKVNGEICPETLLGKYAEYLVRVNATENECPFEEYILRGLTDELNKKIEKLIWQGDTTSNSTDLKWIDGILKQVAADTSIPAGQKVTITGTTASAMADITAVYMAAPEEAIERGLLIFVSPATYRAFIQGLVQANLYHYSGPQDAFPGEWVLPGSDAVVVRTPGLAGSTTIVATFGDNLVYGTDMEGNNEAIDLWWSQDNRVFRYEVKWNSGIAYRFPAMMAVGTV